MLNAGAVITKALNKTTGRPPRAKFVGFFNEVARDILDQPRVWQFLSEPLNLTITDNQITIPVGVSEVLSLQVGEDFFTPAHQLSDQLALQVDNGRSDLRGYTLSADNVVTFHPAQTGTVALIGEIDLTADYADNQNTIFPVAFESLFLAGLRMHWYDLEKDGRFTKESIVYQMKISQAKAWDNRRKPRAQFGGYVRSE